MTFARRWAAPAARAGTDKTDERGEEGAFGSIGSEGVARFQKFEAPLEAAVVIATPAGDFVLIPDSEDPAAYTHLGAVLTESEVRRLEAGSQGAPLPVEAVRALAMAKRGLGGIVEAHRQGGRR